MSFFDNRSTFCHALLPQVRQMPNFWSVRVAALLCLAPFAFCVTIIPLGCGNQDEIERYPVPEVEMGGSADAALLTAHNPSEMGITATYPARMLAAMITQGEQTWFFKLLGPDEAVAALDAEFRNFLKSVRFKDGEPKWTIPASWHEMPGSGLRFATIEISQSTPPLQLTVIPLTTLEGGGDGYVLENLNRWRGQLGLSKISLDQLPEAVEQIQADDATATMATLVGNAPATKSMGQPPFASGKPFGPGRSNGPTVAGPPQPSTGSESSLFSYDTPAGWKTGKQSTMRLAAFVVSNGKDKVETTVFRFPPSGTLANVNRWRGQIGLEPTTQAQLDADSQTIKVDETEGHYVKLVGENQTILAVIINRAGKAWFFKLQGNSKLADSEQKRFESFVKSVKFK